MSLEAADVLAFAAISLGEIGGAEWRDQERFATESLADVGGHRDAHAILAAVELKMIGLVRHAGARKNELTKGDF